MWLSVVYRFGCVCSCMRCVVSVVGLCGGMR